MTRLVFGLSCLLVLAQASAAELSHAGLAKRYEQFLLLQRGDYRSSRIADKVFDGALLRHFERAVEDAHAYPYDLRGVPAYYDFKVFAENDVSAEVKTRDAANGRFSELFSSTLPMLAYAYLTPGPRRGDNPYYRNRDLLRLYAFVLEYCYSRGLTEMAWVPDHAGLASGVGIDRGLIRPSGDFSAVSLHLGGFIQSIFLMREPLADIGLLDKYRAVARNLAINNGAMYPGFFRHAREDAGISYPQPLPDEQLYYLNADGMRLLVDYFYPYFLLIDDEGERREMADILREVIATNIAIKPGVQGTIKPDGTGFHHGTAYVGAYSPHTFESFAQLLHLVAGTDLYGAENIEAVKLALQSFRTMAQKYTVSTALKGRLVEGDEDGAAIAVTKAMALLAHPDGADDREMQARFTEYFDPDYFFTGDRLENYHAGKRGVPIKGLGIYRLIDDVLALNVAPAAVPSGAEIKPYAAAAFFRRDDWLVTAKGFSRYFWDYEGPLEKHQNSFGQNWSYGLLQVFSTGDPIGERASGHDLSNGWDWYHIPGTTASHYPVERRSFERVTAARQAAGVRQRAIQRNYNSRSFVGGVTLGEHGFFVQDLEAVPFDSPTDLTARKSYFLVGDKVLALGTHIRGGTATDPTHTTLFQTRIRNGTPAGSIDGETDKDLNTSTRRPAGFQASLTDSAGNSYYLVNSTSNLHFSRQRQRSLTPDYERTSGAFVQAFLDHGIKPEGERYEYVLIPADPDGAKLRQLAAEPSDYYRLLDSDRMHLVYFPQEQLTAYAFYEAVETAPGLLVKSANLPAAVITQQQGVDVHVAASVPDIGWQYDPVELYGGLSYGSRHYAQQPAKVHELTLMLRGHWQMADEVPDISLRVDGDETILTIRCSDGLSRLLTLTPADTA